MTKKNGGRVATFRHIECVRNYLNLFIRELLHRGEHHDQTKLEEPEAKLFEEVSSELRGLTYGSEEYEASLKKLEPALKHHYANARHHAEHHVNGIRGMNIIDIVEMLADWKASSLRQNDGNILKSLKENQERYGFSDELYAIFENTFEWLDTEKVFHHGEQS
jgi:hypothetical protein